ncbi:uncharacterized protein MONBRDRAFT_9087 [Monosiga brevicollis MX1]|uniref:Helicase C-terminal domain-containing protein n=1 Tax=Monosiga brevicollis TaxID=81824 RepID=A9V219_MONBE|nr:uncharacterized protein MONBRDRAFT_9087 [Monosiga brevicollis MX1]EDQ88537.1 predicted protein [Monosiga brevicollis MX1]|eukprot:XP_001746641.1 hypothetical protein [Monosiga brevicollis MX1]
MHHAGLHERDRKTVEELFLSHKIQVLVATATLAWGVNLPAHLVVVKGTEFFDGKTGRYVDFDITDILQMTGRAGRPQFDDHGVAVIMVHDVKKHFYKKFMHEPFPVESALAGQLVNHFNAEIVAGTIASKQAAMDYLTWTYFYRRLLMNPSYYHLEDTEPEGVNKFLSELVEDCIWQLVQSGCVVVGEDNVSLEPDVLGRIASYYYLDHQTVRHFRNEMRDHLNIPELLKMLCDCQEFAELPVRHNEDELNGQLAKDCLLPVPQSALDSPHVKANLLLQAHFSRLKLPIPDYRTDTKRVLDQCIRILQAMADVAADAGHLTTTLNIMSLTQMVVQGRWITDSSLTCLPGVESLHADAMAGWRPSIVCLPQLIERAAVARDATQARLRELLGQDKAQQCMSALTTMPRINVSLRVLDAELEALQPDTAYTLEVHFERLQAVKQAQAVAPAFPKPIDESWWLVLGDTTTGELIALKRMGPIRSRSRTTIQFYTPGETGDFSYTFFMMSSAYLGLDQQYDLGMTVTDAEVVEHVEAPETVVKPQ